MNKPTIDDAGTIAIDVPTLLRTKMLLTASSGGGKSWGVRRILEQTFGHAQHIVLDRDGEFHTLRERFDYGLLGDGGEGAVTVESAKMAARRLLELGVSTIVDLSSLRGPKDVWVKNFVEGLMEAPRSLWHPLMVVLDEAHRYAPEVGSGEAASTDAIKELATDGRKRAYCLIACTQRVAALHKSVVAELHNKLIGLTTMDLDVQRAARQLGMKPSKAVDALSSLNPGEFHVVGPALSKRVQLITVGAVETTHPEPGEANMPPTPPRAKILKVLGQLKEIAPEGAKEVSTLEQLKAGIAYRDQAISELNNRVRDLESREETWRNNAMTAVGWSDDDAKRMADLEARIEKAEAWTAVLETLLDDVTKALDGALAENAAVRERQASTADALLEARNMIPNRLEDELARIDGAIAKAATTEPTWNGPVRPAPVVPDQIVTNGSGVPEEMPPMARAFLTVLAQRHAVEGVGSPMVRGYRPEGPQLAKQKILIYAGYAAGGAASRTFADLVRNSWVKPGTSGGLVITMKGLNALGAYEPLPTGKALQDRVLRELAPMEAKMLSYLIARYPNAEAKGEILKMTGYSAGGAASRAFAYLVARDYAVSAGASKLVAAKEFFS